MSKTVDERVVEMRFDNGQFERNVQTSMSTLAKLKQSLNLTGASKGLNDLNSAAKKVDMQGLGSGVEAVTAKFSALQVMGVTALVRITNQAITAGERMVKALTIDPIKTGFQEYETKINAVQTILSNTASKGTTMSDVTKVLDELNLYADKTIYNFAEMTRNIGTFTAAGVGLKESASAIQGIANLAAASGSSSQQASTAMYQLSQALAAGTVKLMDWNSVVNAGMGGQKFQEALKATAREHGIAVDSLIEKHGSFRESLQEGWISAEILNETLSKFTVDGAQKYAKAMMESGKWTQEQADALIKEAQSMEDAATKVKTFTQLWDTLKESAQSGWSQTWEIIIGDFEKARGRLTEVSDLMGKVIGDSANRRNELLEGSLTSKWDVLVKKLNSAGIETENFQNKIVELSGTHKEEFQKMIDESDTFEEALKKGLSAGIIDKSGIKEALKGVTDSVSKFSDEELKAKGYTDEQIAALRELAGQADGTGGSIDELINNIERASGAELIWDSFLNILKSIIAPMGAIRDAWDAVFPPNPEGIYNTIKAVKEFTDGLLKAATASGTLKKITSIFKGIFSVVDIVWTVIKDIAGGIGKVLGNITGLGGGLLTIAATIGDFLSGLRDGIKETDLFGKAIDRVVSFLITCIDRIKEFGRTIGENVKIPKMDGFLGFFKAIGSIGKGVLTGLGKALSSIGSSIVEFLNKIDFSKVMDMINSGLFAGLLLSARNFIKGLTNPTEEIGNFFETLKKSVTSSMDKVKGILDDVRGSLEAYQNNLKAGTLLKIAAAVGILAVALTILSTIDSDKLSTSLGAIAGLFTELIVAMAMLDKINSNATKPLAGLVGSLSNISKTIQMAGLAVSILILAGAMKTLAELDWNGIAKGLVGVGVLVGILVGAAKLMESENKSITKFAGQMIILSLAVGILTIVAKQLASMTWDELGKAGAGILGMITILVAAAKVMDTEYKSVTKFAGQMMLMSAAIGALALVGKLLATMSWEELGKAGSGILGIVTMLVAAVKIMNGENKSITKFAGQMILMSVAIGALTLVGKMISTMSWDELGKAGAGILGLVAMLVAAAKIMDSNYKSVTKFAGQMLLMAASLAVLAPVLNSLGSMSWESIGKGLIAIGVSLAILAVGLNHMNGTLAGSAALLIASAALAIITPVLQTLGSMSWESIVKGLLTLAVAFTVIGVAGLLLSPLIPAILGLAAAFALLGIATLGIGAGLTLIGIGLTSIAAAGTAAAASLVASIGIIVTGLLDLIPSIMGKVGEAITAFCQLIGEVAPQIAEAVLQLVSSVLSSLAEHGPEIADSLFTLLIGLMDVLTQRAPELIGSLVNLVVALINGLAQYVPDFIEAGLNLVSSILRGIVDAIDPIINEILVPLIDIIVGLISGIIEALGPYIQPIVDSISSAIQAICDAFIVLVSQISPIIDSITGLVKQLGDSISQVLQLVANVIQTCGDTISQVLQSIADTINSVFSGIAEVITSIGDSIKSVLDGIADVIEAIGEAALDAGTGFDRLANGVKKITELNLVDMVASLGAVATGIKDISKNSEGLAAVGTGMKQIADNVKISSTAFSTMASGIKTVTTSISSIGGVASSSMAMLRSAVTASVSCFKLLSATAKTATSSLSASLRSAGTSAMNGLLSGIKSGQSKIVSIIRAIITTMVTSVKSQASVFRSTGSTLMAQFANGISSRRSTVSNAVSSTVSGAASRLRSSYGSFYSAGSYLAKGFANGISSGSYAAAIKARAMAQAAEKAARNALKINSPSKVFMKIGGSVPEGFAKGIAEAAYYVDKAVYSMSDGAISNTKKAIARVGEAVNMNVDAQPTIRPVLDLSDVQEGAGAISGMFSDRISLGATANVDALSSTMNQNRQNGFVNEVVSAIGKLRKDLGNTGGNTYIIDGVTYDDGSNISEAVQAIVQAARVERRI